jgi:hypothetical protein
MGDPQAPRAVVTEILKQHGMLRGQRLAPSARLLSIGDHFDWGSAEEDVRAAAAVDGEAHLRWLAAHAPEQVVILAGNHDLARVGELADVDDDAFRALQRDADAHYYGDGGTDAERRFFRAGPALPSTEIVARDLSTYRASQRALVTRLLRRRRMRLAHAEGGLLFSHAGITRRALWHVGLHDDNVDAAAVADALNAALDAAVDACLGGRGSRRQRRPLSIPGLHRPADAIGEGDGVLYHRPTFVDKDQWLEPRRFDPRAMPPGLWQVVGHVRDKRLVSSLAPWSDVKASRDGVIRHLMVSNGKVTYTHGLPPPRNEVDPRAAVIIFIDGGMNACAADDYELLDVARVAVASRVGAAT